MIIIYPTKLVEERRFATMDFSAVLASLGTNITITAQEVIATVYSGVDDNPSAILDGSPQISGNIVGQWLIGGLDGLLYVLTWRITCSDGSVVEEQRRLPVAEDLP